MNDLKGYKIEKVDKKEVFSEVKRSQNILIKIGLLVCKLICIILVPIISFLTFIFTAIGTIIKFALNFIGGLCTIMGIFIFFQFDFSKANILLMGCYFGLGFISCSLGFSVDIIANILSDTNMKLVGFIKK